MSWARDRRLRPSVQARPLVGRRSDSCPPTVGSSSGSSKLAVFDYLETTYNPRRRHSALGNIAPATFEERHTVTTAA